MPKAADVHNAVAPRLAHELIERVRELSNDPRDVLVAAESILAAVVATCVPDDDQDSVVETLRQRLPGRVAQIRASYRRRTFN